MLRHNPTVSRILSDLLSDCRFSFLLLSVFFYFSYLQLLGSLAALTGSQTMGKDRVSGTGAIDQLSSGIHSDFPFTSINHLCLSLLFVILLTTFATPISRSNRNSKSS